MSNKRQIINKLTLSCSQRDPGILSITFQYDSRIVLVSRYGKDTGISFAVYRKKTGIERQLFRRRKRMNFPDGFLKGFLF